MLASPHGVQRFFGRQAELAALDAAHRGLVSSRGAIAIVGGPAGIGKSRLLLEFRKTLVGGSVPLILRTECFEGRTSTLSPIRALISGLPRSDESDIETLAGNALERDNFYRSIERLFFDAAEIAKILPHDAIRRLADSSRRKSRR